MLQYIVDYEMTAEKEIYLIFPITYVGGYGRNNNARRIIIPFRDVCLKFCFPRSFVGLQKLTQVNEHPYSGTYIHVDNLTFINI